MAIATVPSQKIKHVFLLGFFFVCFFKFKGLLLLLLATMRHYENVMAKSAQPKCKTVAPFSTTILLGVNKHNISCACLAMAHAKWMKFLGHCSVSAGQNITHFYTS